MMLYHYFDSTIDPFRNLSDLTDEEADRVILQFRQQKRDSHPTFSDKITDGKEYRKKLYTYEEILQIIDKYGYPQEWNSEGKYGPERYIEAHIWSDEVIEKYSLCAAEKMCESEGI